MENGACNTALYNDAMNLSSLDLIIIITWLTITLGVGVVAGLRSGFEGFWVSGRRARLLPLAASVAATQVGAGAIAGIASATWSAGIGFGLVSLASTVVGFILVGRCAPLLKRFGDRYGAITLPQIFRVRYGRGAQVAAAVVILITYMAILAAQFLATSGLVAIGTGLDLKLAVIFATIGVIAYSAFAGLRGDIVTDIWHFAGMTLGLFVILLPAIFLKHGTSWVSEVPWSIWNPATFGGTGFIVVGLLAGGVVPLLMPELWAKVYASRSPIEARRVMFIAAIAVIPFYLLSIFLGLLGHVTSPHLPSGDRLVFVQMVELLPPGLLGIGVATFLSVVISTANSLMLVVSATILGDLLSGSAQSDKSVWRSRLLTCGVGVLGAGLAIVVPDMVQLLLGAFYILLVLAPPLIALLVWKRATRAAATSSILLGAIVTIAVLFFAPKIAFLPGLLVSGVVFIVVSLASKHAASEQPGLAESLKVEN